jgi:segregation and condensation protein A
MSEFTFKMDNIFQGPLDLLLFLIKVNKIQITDIPIVLITDQYFDYLGNIKDFPMEQISHFISMAAELLYIKSRMLIPHQDNIAISDDENFEDPRLPLVEKLLEYKSLKEAFIKIEKEDLSNNIPIYSNEKQFSISKDEQWESISIVELLNHFESLIKNIPKQSEIIISRTSTTVEEKYNYLLNTLKINDFLLFSTLVKDFSTRSDYICLFLAILELVKSKFATISQHNHFSDIKIQRTEIFCSSLK